MLRIRLSSRNTNITEPTSRIFGPHTRSLRGGRLTKLLAGQTPPSSCGTMLDKDWISLAACPAIGLRLSISETDATKLHAALAADLALLTRLRLMDYSLLVGIHNRPAGGRGGGGRDGGGPLPPGVRRASAAGGGGMAVGQLVSAELGW